jgi:hypothetical protein
MRPYFEKKKQNASQKRTGGVAQIGPEFKLQCCKKRGWGEDNQCKKS